MRLRLILGLGAVALVFDASPSMRAAVAVAVLLAAKISFAVPSSASLSRWAAGSLL
jgi:hypothetical protein